MPKISSRACELQMFITECSTAELHDILMCMREPRLPVGNSSTSQCSAA